jgi:hypothetical protein
MTDSVLELKERKLAEIKSLKRWMSKRTSGIFILMLARILAADQDDPLAASPDEKSATTRGGRKRLATEKQRFYMIGCSVDQMFSRFESAFRVSKEFKLANGNWEVNTLRSELVRHQFSSKEIDAVLQARTPMGAAKRFVAKSLTSRAHPNGISLQTVNSCYSRYLKALESKRTLP